MTSNTSGHVISAYIKASTWNRDSHGLFDYDSRHVSNKTMKSTSSVNIMRLKNEIHLVNSALQQKEYCDKIALLSINDGVFHITNDKISNSLENTEESLWLVVRNLVNNSDDKGYKVKVGDVFRLGRLLFRVKDIKIESKYLGESYLNSTFSNLMIDPNENDFERWHKITHYINGEAPIDATCRFCLQNDSTVTSDSNPLISPCMCSGSVKYIHLACLKKWIESRVQVKEFQNGGKCFSWKNIECELCHKEFPDFFQKDDEYIPLMESYEKDCKNYLEIEHIPRDKCQKSRTINVVSFDKKKEISIGRGYETELRIGDISVSRTHAYFIFHNGNVYLKDNNSKFGTLVLVKKSLKLPANKEISVQIGRTCLTISVKNEESKELKKKIHSVEHSFDNKAQEGDTNNENEQLFFEKIEFKLPKKQPFQKILFQKELENEESEEEKVITTHKSKSKMKANHKMDLEEFQTTLTKKIKNDGRGNATLAVASNKPLMNNDRNDRRNMNENIFLQTTNKSPLNERFHVFGFLAGERGGLNEVRNLEKKERVGANLFINTTVAQKDPDFLLRRFSK